jgi:hypothetical protein
MPGVSKDCNAGMLVPAFEDEVTMVFQNVRICLPTTQCHIPGGLIHHALTDLFCLQCTCHFSLGGGAAFFCVFEIHQLSVICEIEREAIKGKR